MWPGVVSSDDVGSVAVAKMWGELGEDPDRDRRCVRVKAQEGPIVGARGWLAAGGERE